MDVSAFLAVLQNFGIGISASAFVEFLKAYFESRKTSSPQEFARHLDSFLKIQGVTVNASTVIDAFAERGLLTIQGSTLFAPDKITMGAGQNATFVFGNDSVSRTNNTAIHARGNAQVVGSNAAVVQNPDGSVSFLVGSSPNSGMNFYVGSDKKE
ncbi:MAG: hypothetical protein M0P74_07755 [Syntrophales bacterium]|jgi:hypothetical protein|nr:hypothetical protein [Syntrophales bacterium]